jgi:hypothetical protein
MKNKINQNQTCPLDKIEVNSKKYSLKTIKGFTFIMHLFQQIISFPQRIDKRISDYLKSLSNLFYHRFLLVCIVAAGILLVISHNLYYKWWAGIILIFFSIIYFRITPLINLLSSICERFEEKARERFLTNTLKYSKLCSILTLILFIIQCFLKNKIIIECLIIIISIFYIGASVIALVRFLLSAKSVFMQNTNTSDISELHSPNYTRNVNEFQIPNYIKNIFLFQSPNDTPDIIFQIPPYVKDIRIIKPIEKMSLLRKYYKPDEIKHGFLPFFSSIYAFFYKRFEIPNKSEKWYTLISKTTGGKRKTIKSTWLKFHGDFININILQSIKKALVYNETNFNNDRLYKNYKITIDELYKEFHSSGFGLKEAEHLQFKLFCYLYLFYEENCEGYPLIPNELNDNKTKDLLSDKVKKNI